ncbi:MAG: MMPL family transporter [Rhodospirillales bacterium]|nr:MMPL family transporter [Rhodospirillales bacterium]
MTEADRGTEPYCLGETIVKLRWLLIVLSVTAASAAGWGMMRLVFNADNRVLFGNDNPDKRALDALEATYTRNDTLIFVLAPSNGDVFTKDHLLLVHELTERSWKIPYSSRVDSLTNYQHTYARGDDLVVENLVPDTSTLEPRELARIRGVALSEPELLDLVVSTKGDATGVFVTLTLPRKDNDESLMAGRHARDLMTELRAKWPGEIHLSGSVAVDMAFADASESDTKTLIPVMIVLVVLIIGLSLRSILGTVMTFLVIVMSTTTAMGLVGWIGLPVNSVTAAAPVVIMTLSIANCVHILTTFRQYIRRGYHRHEAVVQTLRVDMVPITVTSLTTTIGFLSLNFSDSPPIQELGNLVAVGMVAAYFYAIGFLACGMAVLPARGGSKGVPGTTAMDRLGGFVVARRRALLVVTSVAIFTLTTGIVRIEADDDVLEYFGEDFEFRIGSKFMEERLTGLDALEFSVPSGAEQGISSPRYLEQLDAFAQWFRGQPNVTHVSVLTDVIKRLNRNLHGDDPAYYRIPEDREMAAQYLLLYEMSLPYGLDLNNQINVSKSHSRVSVVRANATSAEMLRMAEQAEVWLRENTPEIATQATGLTMAYAHITDRNIRAMLRGTLLSLVLISGILLFVLRSVRIGLVSLAPNLFPAAVAFGIWGYLFGDVNLGVSIVVAITLGIVVDDTVHFLSKYLLGRREHGMDAEHAVRFAFSHVGKALWVTSFALIAGFSVLATSDFAVNGATGLMSAITITVALLADFFFLPPLLIWLDGERK